MSEKSLIRNCWCNSCKKFTLTGLQRIGTRQRGKDNYNVIFKWECSKCEDSDIEELSSDDWDRIEKNLITHISFD